VKQRHAVKAKGGAVKGSLKDGTPVVLISKTVQRELPALPFEKMGRVVFGRRGSVSVVFIGDARSRTLNRIHRKKDSPANVLSFPLSHPQGGEIFINLARARVEAPHFGLSYRNYVGYLFIHGLLHLEGHDHGGKMDEAEQTLCKRFSIPYPYGTHK